jgi:CheY-like chemotaxis protein
MSVSPGDGASAGLLPHRFRRILVVDDDAEAASAVAALLVELGAITRVCNHAEGALAELREEKFDLILTDYRMPELTGIDFICILREAGFDLPVIMMSGYSATEDRVLARKLGIVALLKKPVSLDVLVATLSCVPRHLAG